MKNGLSFFSSHPMFILEQQSLNILDANDRAEQLYGYSREEFKGMNISNLGHQDRWGKLVGNTLKQDSVTDKIWTHSDKQGQQLHIQFTHHQFNLQGRKVLLAVAHDVSHLVKKQESPNKLPRLSAYESQNTLAEIRWNSDLKVQYWSNRAEELFGWKKEEVANQENFIKQFMATEERQATEQKFAQAVSDLQDHYVIEGKVFTKGGSTMYCKWYHSFQYNREGQLDAISSRVTDITGHKESENLFRALSHKTSVGVYLIQDNTFKYVNPRFCDIFGYRQEEIEHHMGPIQLTHPDDQQKVQEDLRQRLKSGNASRKYDFRGITKEGDVIHVNTHGTAIIYMGKPAVVGTLVDVTNNKETLEKYWASVESFQNLFNSITDAIYIQRKDGTFLEINEGALEMYGYKREEIRNQRPSFLAAPGKVDLEETRLYLEKALQGEPQTFEWWGQRKNGEVFPKEVLSSKGTFFGEEVVITIARDISERYEAEEQLRKSEEMFRQLFKNAPIPIAFMDKHQEIKQINQAFTNIFGYTKEDVKGINIDRLLVSKEREEMAHKISKSVAKGNTVHHFSKRRCKDGGEADVLIYGLPVMVNDKPVAIFGIYVDITDRRQAEEQVRKSLKEKEVLLAEIHHRVKNNLAVITGLLELQSYNTDSKEAQKVLQASQMRINSIALIHEKLYQNEDLSEISFDIYLEQLIEVIVTSLRSEQTQISIDVQADPVQLTVNQAIPCGLILNELITNAYKHAFPYRERGTINISLQKEDADIHLCVQDDGVGIDEDIDFNKPQSLGLTLINTLSKQLNGTSSFEAIDPGTEFCLQFELDY